MNLSFLMYAGWIRTGSIPRGDRDHLIYVRAVAQIHDMVLCIAYVLGMRAR